MQDLIAGQMDMTIANTATAPPHVRAGRIKAFAVTTKDGIAIAPEILLSEEGVPSVPVLAVGGSVRPQGHAEGHHRQAQRSPPLAQRTILPCARSLSTRGSSSRFGQAGVPRRRLAPTRKPRSRNGGRSSRRLASRSSDLVQAGKSREIGPILHVIDVQ